MKGKLALVYSLVSYGVFFMTFLYAVGFLTGVVVWKSIDSGGSASFLGAVAVDVLLLGLFGVQHSVMARPAFKKWWKRIVPSSVERSTYVLVSSLCLGLLFWQWRALPLSVWEVGAHAARVILWGICALGWLIVLLSTFMISHTHLFGLSQVWNRMMGRPAPEPRFQTKWLYGRVRHPLMMGFIIAFWATPSMSTGHLLFASAATGYILVATLIFEERDLLRFIGEPYRNYRRRVPAFLPRLGRGIRLEELLPGSESLEGRPADDGV